MKFRPTILLALVTVALVLALAGCGLLNVSIEQRIETFVGSLNTSTRIDTYSNFSSSAMDYSAIKDGTWWGGAVTGYFPTDGMGTTPYSYASGFDVSTPSDVQVTISGPPTYGPSKSYMFVMINESSSAGLENWKILELYVWTGVWSAMVQ